jgi:hypothetical protein
MFVTALTESPRPAHLDDVAELEETSKPNASTIRELEKSA